MPRGEESARLEGRGHTDATPRGYTSSCYLLPRGHMQAIVSVGRSQRSPRPGGGMDSELLLSRHLRDQRASGNASRNLRMPCAVSPRCACHVWCGPRPDDSRATHPVATLTNNESNLRTTHTDMAKRASDIAAFATCWPRILKSRAVQVTPLQ